MVHLLFVPASELTTGANRGELWRSWRLVALSWELGMPLLPRAPSLASGRAALSHGRVHAGQRGTEPGSHPSLLPCKQETILQSLNRQHLQERRRLPEERSKVFLLDIFGWNLS